MSVSIVCGAIIDFAYGRNHEERVLTDLWTVSTRTCHASSSRMPHLVHYADLPMPICFRSQHDLDHELFIVGAALPLAIERIYYHSIFVVRYRSLKTKRPEGSGRRKAWTDRYPKLASASLTFVQSGQ